MYIQHDEGTKNHVQLSVCTPGNATPDQGPKKSRFLFMKFMPTKILSSFFVFSECKMKQFPTSTSQQFSLRNDTEFTLITCSSPLFAPFTLPIFPSKHLLILHLETFPIDDETAKSEGYLFPKIDFTDGAPGVLLQWIFLIFL